jgi:hypothetical protein
MDGTINQLAHPLETLTNNSLDQVCLLTWDLEWKRNFAGWSTISGGTGWSRLRTLDKARGCTVMYLDVIEVED